MVFYLDSNVKMGNSTSRTTPSQETESYSSSTELYYNDKLARGKLRFQRLILIVLNISFFLIIYTEKGQNKAI